MNEQDLFKFFGKLVVNSGDEYYFPINLAQEFISKCNQNDIAIIGIEGFEIKNTKIIPHLEKIADFSSDTNASWFQFKKECNYEARKFVQHYERYRYLYLNFCLMTSAEWSASR
jgi:hypothetical protein